MTPPRRNIVLIGMPGAGKSTVGALLAQSLGLEFTDTDALIERREGRSLQAIVDDEGHQALRRIEAEVLSTLDCEGHVIATGGSAVYSDRAMTHLRAAGVIVQLHVALPVILERVTDIDTRGLAREAGQPLEALYHEREALYRRHADLRVDVSGYDPAASVEAVRAAIERADNRGDGSGIMPPL
ncbi:shikimate kinase [Spiribacter insolitus]|uniref:Shikimate kinase n=1 Tax=Spiribacter insolitus TaxID=3122417 RepID=A0ABV3T6V8_9GAMM